MGTRLFPVRELVALALLLAAAGCDSSPRRQAVHGQVTLDGRPLILGVFEMMPDGRMPKANALIENGQFLIEADRGPFPGGYTVLIRAPMLREGQTAPKSAVERAHLLDASPEALPARYHSKSELRATVTADGPNEFNFDLQSK